MMNHSRRSTGALAQPADSTLAVVVRALVVILALAMGASDSHATTFYWTGGSDSWQSTTAWDGAPSFPGSGDNAFFTNAATYTVTLNADVVNIQSNFFDTALDSTAIITLNLNTYELNPAYTGTSPGAFVVGNTAGSTVIVYLASSTAAGKGLIVPGRIIVGRNGFGTLFVTNGNVSAATTILANAGSGCGTLVLSGPSVVWSNSTSLAVGNNSNSFGSALVITNSAEMDVVSSFRVGSGSSSGGSSNNTLLLDTGGKLYTQTGPATIGNNGTTASFSPSYNNSATVQGGAVWDNGNATFVVGYYAGMGAATGNVLTVGAGGVVTNISHLSITASNTLNLAGGTVDGLIDCDGTVQGFGTVLNDVTITGILSPFNSLGTLVFNKKLTLGSTTTTTVQLGTTAHATVVGGVLTLGGTLNITDGGGFAAGTYTLFTYNSTLTTSGLTIGTTPTGGFTCTIDTNTAGVVKLNVTGGPPVAPVAAFSGSPTSGMAPLPVTFTDGSTGTITNRVWNFGDGNTTNTTTAATLGHTYTAAGTYTVSLTVFGPGGSSTTNQLNYITVTTSSDTTPPQLQIISPTDYQAFTNATITASGTASDASGLTGVTVNGVAASLAGSNWSHSVTLSLGTNTLTVIATDASANLNTATQVVHAVFSSASTPTNAPPQLQIVSPTDYQAFTNATITASGTASDASGLAGVTVNGVAASLAGSNWSQSVTLSLGTNTITVIATDASAQLNTATQVVHAVLNSASVSTNALPVITAGPTVTNAALQVGNVIVVVAGDTNVFSVGATNPLSYQWSFGDGVTSAWSPSNTVDHVYTTNCGPYTASVTISNGSASVTSNFTIVVACQLHVAKLAPKLNFAKTNSDSCTITGTFDLPANTSFTGMVATVDIGGGSLTFTLPGKGTALNGRSRFNKPTFNKRTGLWTLNATFNNGFWQTDWANYGMTNATILKPGALVSDLPVILLLDTEAFMATTNLHYTAKQGKSGSAK